MKDSGRLIALVAMLAALASCTKTEPRSAQTSAALAVSASPAPPPQQELAKPQSESKERPTAFFDYRGLRLGMSGEAALEVLRAIEQKQWDEECSGGRCDEAYRHSPECGDLACGNGGGLDVYLNAGRVWGIQQNLGGVSIESYVLALARKYGEPRVERRTYRNGLGNESHGDAWLWGDHARDSLQVMEVCAGASNTLEDMPDIGCLVLHSFAYAPKQATPTI